jgi:uncharacterized protein (TIGR02611 family)
MSKHFRTIRKVIVGLIGFPLLVLGIILIPLPGPGLIVCFLALLILSIEFKWVDAYLNRARLEMSKLYQVAKARADKFEQSNDK